MGSEKGLVRDGKRSNRAKQKEGQRLDERRINRSSVRMLRMLPRRDDSCSFRAARKDRTSRSKRCTYFFPLVGREGFRSGRGFSSHSRHRVRGERDRRRQREEERGRRRSEKRAAIPKLQERSRGDDGGGAREGGLTEALDEEESRGREFHKKRRGKKKVKVPKSGERGEAKGEGEELLSIFALFVAAGFLFSARIRKNKGAEEAAGLRRREILTCLGQEEEEEEAVEV